jgi:transcriptional regulator with XRE-family HTH domain
MLVPSDIAERIRAWVEATPKTGLHADHEAARYGGISLMGTIGATWLLRPDGTFWDVDDDSGRPLQPLKADLHITALVAGTGRHPWLAAILPSRPPGALSCGPCTGRGKLALGSDAEQFIYCSACRGLGWTSPAPPPMARRIKESRERLGLTAAGVAAGLGMPLASYQDLELHDDEVFLTLSPRELCALANLLRVSARALVSDDLEAAILDTVTGSDVAAAIRRRLAADGCDIHMISEELGWELARVLDDPGRIWDAWNVEGLRDVCARLGLDWRAILPDREG